MSLEARVAALETLVASFNRGSFSYVDLVSKEREREWTPTLTFATPGDLSVVYSTRIGRFGRGGGWCIAHFSIITSTFTHTTASGDCLVTGVPFTAKSDTGVEHNSACVWRGITKANFTSVVARIAEGDAQFKFVISGSGQAATTVQTGDMPTGGTVVLRSTIIYRV